MKHPLKIDQRILSIPGERDEDDNGPRFTGPNAIGVITHVRQSDLQGWTYGVTFKDKNVFVFLSEQYELFDGQTNYEVVHPMWEVSETLVCRVTFVKHIRAETAEDAENLANEGEGELVAEKIGDNVDGYPSETSVREIPNV